MGIIFIGIGIGVVVAIVATVLLLGLNATPDFGEVVTEHQWKLHHDWTVYMNNSGKAVQKTAAFYKIPTDRIIVMQDDISLDIGKIRIRRKGSDGGQKGMRDIIELLGTDNILRIKIGVGAKPHPDYDLASWVLSKSPKETEEDLNKAIKNSVASVKEIITRSVDSAMNKYNS
jgi:PTH1 family peptidyl-tRNA hydrolase